MGNLGETFDQMRDLFAEIVANRVGVGERILHNIMKQTCRYRHGVQSHVSENIGYFERVDQVRFAGGALLPTMLTRRKEVSTTEQVQIRLRVIPANLIADFFDANHSKNSGQRSVVGGQKRPTDL